ncbi:GntR family transcriptional regulator [Kitasatospora sp. CM 4170]|uniref:GntR family transcriptional regulator n=1 Tax=Kitasatospora aburaviensis TaxID=67265 RepID=A0ABW1EVV4_9ACTN|nr:GntR family transcriptional regulator [Kitasatospora sp. CM 4170]WNM46783.1 GntR family transcriptional regulator [Kitasatospora sp. CM 4170]
MSGTGAGDTRPVIHRNSLREQIAGALREEMMAGRLAAGRNFTVKEIADLYGVSATPAREALVDLGAQGLLRTEHHRGFTVPELGWDDFLEIFEARVLLTDSYVRQLALRPETSDTDARLPSLRRRADAAVRAARAGNLDVMVGCDRRFWQEVAGLLGNRRIGDYLDWLRVQSWMFAAPYLRGMPRLDGVCWDRHLDLVDAIAVRDLTGAYRIICEYNLFTVRLLAELTGRPLESVGVLPLLTAGLGPAEPAPAAGSDAGPDGPAADGSGPGAPAAGAVASPAGSSAGEDTDTGGSAGGSGGPARPEPPHSADATAGRARLRDRELGLELGRELGLGLGLVPQPRSVAFTRFGRRPADPPSGHLPEGRPDPHRAPGR